MRLSGAFDKAEIPKAALYPVMAISGVGVLWFIQMLWLFSMLLALIRKIEKGRLYSLCGKANGCRISERLWNRSSISGVTIPRR
jgi:hypothetical protein